MKQSKERQRLRTCSTGETPCLGRAPATKERDEVPPEAMRATWSMTVAPRPRKTRRGRAACGDTGARRAQGAAARALSLLGCGLLRARRRRGRGARVAMDGLLSRRTAAGARWVGAPALRDARPSRASCPSAVRPWPRGVVAARAAQERTQAHLFSDDLPDWGRVGRSLSIARCHAGPRFQ